VLSPQTIYQSAVDGVPISGRNPVPEKESLDVKKVKLHPGKLPPTGTPDDMRVEFEFDAKGPGTVHIFLWVGDHGAIPVFITSCPFNSDPTQAKDYGLSACATTDGGIPPWSPDMSGRVLASFEVKLDEKPFKDKLKIDITSREQYEQLRDAGSALISFETPNDEVQALFVPELEK